MNGKQFLIVLIAVIISSFVGGMSAQILTQNGAAFAEGTRGFQEEIKTKALHLVGENEKVRASFYLGAHGSPQIVLYDKEGTNRLNAGLSPAGNPGVSLNDENFNTLINLDTKYGHPDISISSSENKLLWRVPNN
jgi:hypothetical protein